MYKHLLLFVLICINFTLSAQYVGPQTADTIYEFKGHYIYNAKSMGMAKLEKLTKPVPYAYQSIKAARANNTWSTLLAIGGSVFVVYSGAYAASLRKIHVPSAFIGLGSMAMAVAFSKKAEKYTKRGIRIFNEAQKYPPVTYNN